MDIKDLKPVEVPTLDLSNLPEAKPDYSFISKQTQQMVDEISASMDERAERTEEARQAMLNTAENTQRISANMDRVLENQLDLIDIQRSQLNTLKAIFASGEDETSVVKEILNILEKEDPEVFTLLKDKGGDIAVAGILSAIKVFLQMHGITLL